MNQSKITGIFWHVHHNKLCEYCYDYQKRVDAIKNKPEEEIKARLRLFKKVKGKLPKELVEAWKKRDEARKKYDEAWKKHDEARKKWDETRKKHDEAGKKWDEAREKHDEAWKKWEELLIKYKPFLEKLHKKECNCKEWDGRELVFG